MNPAPPVTRALIQPVYHATGGSSSSQSPLNRGPSRPHDGAARRGRAPRSHVRNRWIVAYGRPGSARDGEVPCAKRSATAAPMVAAKSSGWRRARHDARSAIVDVEHGHAAHALRRRRDIALVYNGEIYNAPQLLRRDLERAQDAALPHPQRHRSHLAFATKRTPRAPSRPDLAGMWAFAIHDRRRRARPHQPRPLRASSPSSWPTMGGAIGVRVGAPRVRPCSREKLASLLFANRPRRRARDALPGLTQVPEHDTIYRRGQARPSRNSSRGRSHRHQWPGAPDRYWKPSPRRPKLPACEA